MDQGLLTPSKLYMTRTDSDCPASPKYVFNDSLHQSNIFAQVPLDLIVIRSVISFTSFSNVFLVFAAESRD